jgi:hypothetical protein
MLKAALAAVCLFVLIAVGFLSVSVAILRPPRVNYAAWFTVATVVAVQIAVTFVAQATAALILRRTAFVGALVVGALGGWMVRDTLTSAHFEGYALVLGSMLLVQAALTIAVFLKRSVFRTA